MSVEGLRSRVAESIHEVFSVPAIHISGGSGGPETSTTVRRYEEPTQMGSLSGFSGPAEVIETNPEIVLPAGDITPTRGDLVVVSASEGYRVEVVFPQVGIMVKCQVTRLKASELSGLPTP